MFGKPPSKLESLRGSLTDTVAGTFESIHEKLDDLPLERPLEKLKDVKETVAGTVVHGLEAASHGLGAVTHKAGDALHAAGGALHTVTGAATGAAKGAAGAAKGAAGAAKDAAVGGIASGAATVGSVTHGVLQSAHNTKEAAQEAAAHAAAAAREKAQHRVEGLSAAQEKLRKKLEKKLHKEAKQGSKAVHEKVDNTRDTVQVLRHRAGGKRDDILAEVQIADSTSKWLWIGIGVLAGVLLGILLAPTTGRRSRALIKDKVNKAGHEAADLGHNAKAKATDIANRAAGKIHEIKGGAEEDLADDRTVADRVRTAIGESPITRNMERLNIDCVNGIVTVRGPIADTELQGQIEGIVRAVKGVVDVQLFLLTEETEDSPEAFVG
jgi:gas vesicle protein